MGEGLFNQRYSQLHDSIRTVAYIIRTLPGIDKLAELSAHVLDELIEEALHVIVRLGTLHALRLARHAVRHHIGLLHDGSEGTQLIDRLIDIVVVVNHADAAVGDGARGRASGGRSVRTEWGRADNTEVERTGRRGRGGDGILGSSKQKGGGPRPRRQTQTTDPGRVQSHKAAVGDTRTESGCGREADGGVDLLNGMNGPVGWRIIVVVVVQRPCREGMGKKVESEGVVMCWLLVALSELCGCGGG